MRNPFRIIIIFTLIGYWSLVIGASTSLGANSEPSRGVGYFASAEVKLTDVPDTHWASAAVYDLIKLGITKGYPDGTYRGDKPITRYETAIFLSKLVKALGSDDLRAELKDIRDELVEMKQTAKQDLTVKGSYLGDGKVGNVLARGPERGGVASYRLILTATKEIGDGSDLKVNLDTMDFGYNNDGAGSFPGNGLPASELFDIESNLKLNPVNLKLTYGPGLKQHTADPTGIFPSEVGVVYRRPSTGLVASTSFLGADVSGGYHAVQGRPLDATGRINTSWLTSAVGFTLSKIPILNSLRFNLIGDYFSRGLLTPAETNTKAKINVSAPLGDKVQVGGTVGLAKTASHMMVAGDLSLNDPLDTGTVVTIHAAKIGSNYIDSNFAIEQLDIAGYDNFDRPLANGSVNVGGQLVQTVSDRTKLIGKGDVRLNGDYKYAGAGARLTAQGGISYNIAPNVDVDAAYRVHQDKGTGDTSDLAAVGLMYKF